jgi:hypothetical protein
MAKMYLHSWMLFDTVQDLEALEEGGWLSDHIMGGLSIWPR